jgi:nitroreductase
MQSRQRPRSNRHWIDETDFPHTSNRVAQFRYLTRYAMLAPSSHNTQPWKFATRNYRLLILADPSRWLHAADPDGRELYISIGCALENLLIAAAHFGYGCEVDYFPSEDHPDAVARIALVPATRMPLHHPELFDAITTRATSRRPYDSRPLLDDHVRLLQSCCEPEIDLELRGDEAIKSAVHELVRWADEKQYARPDYRRELGHWIGQGAFGSSWPVAKIGQAVVSTFNVARLAARADARALQSAPLVGLLSSALDDRLSQVRVGQVFERVALTATRLSIQLQPVSQIVEVRTLRGLVADLFGVTKAYPQHLFRVGYSQPAIPRSPRRKLEEVWC